LLIKDNNYVIILAWKIKDLEYFQSNLTNKNDAYIVIIKSQTYYQNIYVFTNHAQDIVASKNEAIIKNNLHVCLHKIVLS